MSYTLLLSDEAIEDTLEGTDAIHRVSTQRKIQHILPNLTTFIKAFFIEAL